MRRFILTGAPGSGKTSVLRALEQLGYAVVEEAATDVIAAEHARGNAEPHRDPGFTAAIARLQAQRLAEPARDGVAAQVHDRSVVCTLALARYLGHPVPAALRDQVARVTAAGLFDRRVLFVRPLGFIENTAARRIGYQQSLEFERVHEEDYRRLGFELIDVPAAPVAERAALIDSHIRSWLAR